MAGRAQQQTKENQDNFLFCEQTESSDVIGGVLDGHGTNGGLVSAFVKQQLVSALTQTRIDKAALLEVFGRIAIALRHSGFEVEQSGATTVLCAKVANQLVVAHVGDSRCILVRKPVHKGEVNVVALTQDHKPDVPSERFRISNAGGFVEPTRFGASYFGPSRVWKNRQLEGGLAVSRSFGDTALTSVGVVAVPEILIQEIEADDRHVVLASDGVWDQLSNEEVGKYVMTHKDPRKAAEMIVKEARKRWESKGDYVDDITVVIMAVQQPQQQLYQHQQR
eukprot:m.60330 g.60330  ORF g.60330 m.60330 type:complete len:279 (+) comp13652_c2_seq2:203-1039(+)